MKKSRQGLREDKLKLIPHGKPMTCSRVWGMLQLAQGLFHQPLQRAASALVPTPRAPSRG